MNDFSVLSISIFAAADTQFAARATVERARAKPAVAFIVDLILLVDSF